MQKYPDVIPLGGRLRHVPVAHSPLYQPASCLLDRIFSVCRYSGTVGGEVVSAARGPEGHHRDENVLGTKRMFHCRPANHFSEANWTHFRACICCNASGQGIDQVRQDDRGRWCAIRWTCRHPSPRRTVLDWQKTVEKGEAVALQQSIRHASSLARNGRTILRRDGSSMRGSPILPLLELLPLLPFVAFGSIPSQPAFTPCIFRNGGLRISAQPALCML